MKKNTNPYSVYQGKLRRLWEESPMKYEALRRAKIGPNNYMCQSCNKTGIIYKLIEVDHKEPVVRIKDQPGETDHEKLIHYITRLNCSTFDLQVLGYECCHQEKSKKENKARKKAA